MNFLQRVQQAVGFGRRAPPATAQVRGFHAARLDRLTADWLAETRSINEELRSDLDKLRARGRDLGNNNDYARRFRQMVADNIVGASGVRLQVRVEDRPGVPDRLANQAIEAAWKDWQSVCDVTRHQHFRDLCATLVGGLPSDGEFLVRQVRGADAGNRYGYALQLIDVDRIATQLNKVLPGGAAIIMGVEVDAYRRPVAVHVYTSHPDSATGSRQTARLAAEDIIHCFRVERGEQLRGIPWMAPGMLSLHHLGKLKLAALLAAEHGANHFGFFTTPDGQAPVGGLDDAGQPIAVSQPGTYDTLPPGVSFQAYDSKYPEANFAPFVKTTLQRIASGWGVAYHSLANDLEGVNFSSIRSGTLEERDRWMADQEWFIASFLEPVYANWLTMALMMGAITMPNGSALPAAKRDKFARHEWQPRRWDWVDTKADTEDSILKVRAGLMSPQDLAAAMGYDFEDTLKAIADAQALAAEYGVPLPAYDALPGATAAAPAAPEPVPARELEPLLEQQLRELRQEMRDQMATLRQVPPAPQPVVVNNSVRTEDLAEAVAQASANVLAEVREHHLETVAALRQELADMQINVAAPIVNVAAPTVNVEAPAVTLEATVPAAQVVVNNTHPTRAIQTVERDRNDEIVRTITTYET